jgi:hypothetical protein
MLGLRCWIVFGLVGIRVFVVVVVVVVVDWLVILIRLSSCDCCSRSDRKKYTGCWENI